MRLERRDFLKMVGGGALMIGVLPGCKTAQVVGMKELSDDTFSPNVFISITPEGRVILALNKSEMGQGVATGSAVLVAEELEVAVESIEAIHVARPEFENSLGEAALSEIAPVGMQITGGSSSTPENYTPLRKAAASARLMLVAAAAAKWQTTAEQCRAEDGHVIHSDGRKIAYGALTKEAAAQDVVDDPPLKERSAFTKIGKPVIRVDAKDKVTGAAKFGTDYAPKNVVRAYVIHPPQQGGQVKSLDAAAAKEMPGVVDVFEFERGVAVLAEKYWQAAAAARTVKVTFTEGATNGLHSDALSVAAKKVAKGDGSTRFVNRGNVDKALAEEDVVTVDATYEAPYLAHAPMEPMNCTVHVQGDRVQVWAPTQSPTIVAEGISRLLGIDRSDVQVDTLMLGGGFGRRGVPDFAVEAAMIARKVDRPVQLVWSREDDMRGGYYRPAAVARMRGAVSKKDGRVKAVHYHGVAQSIFMDQSPFLGAVFPDWMPKMMKRLMLRANVGFINSGALPDFISLEGMATSAYDVESFRVDYTPVRTAMPVSFWRSVGHSYNAFIKETFMDELAHAAKKDPFEFRRAHLTAAPRHLAVLEAAAELGNWGKPIEEGWGRGIAVHWSFGSYVAQVVEAGVVDDRVRVRKVACAVDCGVAVTPDLVAAQMESGIIYGLSAAIDQRLDIVDGVVQQDNFDTYPCLRMHESPEIVVKVMDSDEHPHGVGEPGLPPVLGGLSNAIFAATGVRLRAMPMQQAWDRRKETT
ncbi:MAG: molybdopterin cofactor-binding domain-containing protein [Deltaproteobacteria bacterium]|jgi:isoquinoline 1-oxidoreductase beta subunit